MSAPADDGFVFSASLTAEDYMQFSDAIARRQRQSIPLPHYRIIVLACALPVALGAALLARNAGLADAWSVGLLCGFAYLIGVQMMAVLARAANARFQYGLSEIIAREYTNISIVLNAQGIEATDGGMEVRWRWRAIDAVTVENGALMFWTGVSDAIRIPERAFASSSERDAVTAYARTHGAGV